MILDVRNVTTTFTLPDKTVQAVRSVSFTLGKGEALGIVGESGSGKSVLTHSLLRLIAQPPGEISGSVRFHTTDLLTCSDQTLRSVRGNRIALVFQDPSAAFNPYLRIGDQLIEPLMLHRSLSRKEAVDHVVEALEETGIAHARDRIRAYPHQFSGGMLQRAMIAMALVMQPEIIIADEPTTALDVTVQAQLLRILKRLVSKRGISVIFITHNLGIVSGFCDRIHVMYAGRILESASAGELFANPCHPYTRALIQSVPGLTAGQERLMTIPGVPPDLSKPPRGCPFHPRCPYCAAVCSGELPELTTLEDGRQTACIRFLAGDITWEK